MRARTGYNPKRKMAAADLMTRVQRAALAARVAYGGNPEHRRFRMCGLPRLAEEAA